MYYSLVKKSSQKLPILYKHVLTIGKYKAGLLLYQSLVQNFMPLVKIYHNAVNIYQLLVKKLLAFQISCRESKQAVSWVENMWKDFMKRIFNISGKITLVFEIFCHLEEQEVLFQQGNEISSRSTRGKPFLEHFTLDYYNLKYFCA